MRQHKGPKWDDGAIVKRSFRHRDRPGPAGLRAEPAPADLPGHPRARGAGLHLRLRDAEQRYRHLQACEQRLQQLATFAAQGLPSGRASSKLLEPFRAQLPPRVFGPAFVAPRTDADAARRCAATCSRRATCSARPAGSSRPTASCATPRARPSSSSTWRRRPGGVTDWQRNLEKLGITLKVRSVDFALYQRRLEEYDFDMVTIVEGDFTLPKAVGPGAALRQQVGRREGQQQLRGVKSPAVDHLIAAMADARARWTSCATPAARSTAS